MLFRSWRLSHISLYFVLSHSSYVQAYPTECWTIFLVKHPPTASTLRVWSSHIRCSLHLGIQRIHTPHIRALICSSSSHNSKVIQWWVDISTDQCTSSKFLSASIVRPDASVSSRCHRLLTSPAVGSWHGADDASFCIHLLFRASYAATTRHAQHLGLICTPASTCTVDLNSWNDACTTTTALFAAIFVLPRHSTARKSTAARLRFSRGSFHVPAAQSRCNFSYVFVIEMLGLFGVEVLG